MQNRTKRNETSCTDTSSAKNVFKRAVVVAQLAEPLLPSPEGPGSNTAVTKLDKNIYLLSTVKKK